MAKGAVIARILSEYDAKGTKQARKDLAELQGNFSEFGKKAKEAFAVAAAASAAMAVAFGVSAVKAAMAEQQAMAVLNNTLHNTVGANQAVMASTEEYIKQAALRYNFTTDQVIPSLQSLVVATKDVAKAETLQHLAMDISANKGKNLNEVSLALAKAYLGNFNALKRMGVPLSENVIKTKDFSAATKELASAFGGSAAAAADTFAGRVGRIGIAFDIVKKTIGNAIIVALQPFLDKFMGALPKIEAWLTTNSKKIAAFFITGITYGVAFAQTLYDIFNFVARNIKVFAELGAVAVAIFAGSKIASGVSAFITGINTIIKVMKVLREASLAAGFAEAIATGGVSAAAGLAAATAAFVGINLVMDKFDKNVQKNAKGVGDLKFDFKGLTTTAADYLKGLTGVNNATSTNTKLTAEQIKALADLKKLGVVPTGNNATDAIELEAAALNLKKQNNIEELNKIQALKDTLAAQVSVNEATQRYNDILSVLADSHISSEEIAVLAAKWGVSQDAVVAYIAQVTGAAAFDPTELGSPGAVAKQGWTNALAELNQYFDGLAAVADHHVTADEVVALANKWGISKDAVVAYLAKLTDVSQYDPKDLSSPGAVAADGWTNALSSLNLYYAALANPPAAVAVLPPGTGGAGTGTIPDTSGMTAAFAAAQDAAQAAQDAADAATANAALLDSLQTTSDAAAVALDQAFGRAENKANPLLLGGANEGAPLSQLSTANFGASGLVSSGNIAGQTGGGSSTGSGDTTIIVQGSVITKSDMVASIRNDLLQGQLSGKPVSFSAAAL
jgi:hypothetical protein